MNKIEFKAGYYEWDLYINDIFVYCDNDGFSDYLSWQEENASNDFDFKAECECYSEMCIEEIKENVRNNFEEYTCYNESLTEEAKNLLLFLSDSDYELIKKTIYETYYNYYSGFYL